MIGFNLNPLGIDVFFDLSNNQTKYIEEQLPKELLDGSIIEKSKKKRCILNFKKKIIFGGYGILQETVRIENNNIKECFIKYSKEKTLNILNEALLQYISYLVLKNYNIQYMISNVYDIYKRNDIIFFCMEKINGMSILNFLLESKHPEIDFIDSLIQLCIILYILKKDIYLDHRDLRYTNLFIVKKHTIINFNKYILDTNFHICLLDFGFACIGSNKTIVNASEGIFHNSEECLKPGRDLFQIVASLMCLKEFRDKINSSFLKILDSLFIYNGTDYSKLAKTSCEWTYILTSESSFNFPFFAPENFIKYLYDLRKSYV
jgi:serine/threonine protein kinase